MIYEVSFRPIAEDQICTLPREGLLSYLPAHVAIAMDPWGGLPYGRDPEGNMRVRSFGEAGMVVYLILERDRRVWVLDVLWTQ